MQAMQTTSGATATGPGTPSPLQRMYAAIRAAADPGRLADRGRQRGRRSEPGKLPRPTTRLAGDPGPSTPRSDRSQVLHGVEPDGGFSVVALISRPGQATSVHATWCAVAVVAGAGTRSGSVATGAAAPAVDGYPHRPGGDSEQLRPSRRHPSRSPTRARRSACPYVYGTDIGRIGSSVRRTYDLPIVEQIEID